MKHYISFTLLLLLNSVLTGVAQTQVIVEQNDGDKHSFVILETGKMYFEANNLVITEDGESSSNILISEIRKITLNDGVSSIEENKENKVQNISLYPNPATDYVYMTNIEGNNIAIMLFSIEGKLLENKIINTTEPLNVSHLLSGIYLIKINNQTLKLIKK